MTMKKALKAAVGRTTISRPHFNASPTSGRKDLHDSRMGTMPAR